MFLWVPFFLQSYWCLDINECSSANICHVNAICINTNGSYTCTCMEGYSGDGVECEGKEISPLHNLILKTSITSTCTSYECVPILTEEMSTVIHT